jgi:hypothetical protein
MQFLKHTAFRAEAIFQANRVYNDQTTKVYNYGYTFMINHNVFLCPPLQLSLWDATGISARRQNPGSNLSFKPP